MYINLSVQPNEITEPTTLLLNECNFPILNIDVDSYIVGAIVETGLNFRMQDGCYSLQIGKYCSLAEDLRFMIDINHDYRSVYQGNIKVLEGITVQSALRRKGEILILNDAWIGHGVTIMDGVVIGNGAVVAAESVVTKDVPDYAIVAGNPARIVGWRYEEDIRNKMSAIAWWNWGSRKIREAAADMTGDVRDFVQKYEYEIDLMKRQLQNYDNPISDQNSGTTYMYLVDDREEYPLVMHVIEEFCTTFADGNATLVLYIPQDVDDAFKRIMAKLAEYEDTDCRIQIVDGRKIAVEAVLYHVDGYITNRMQNNVQLVDQARRYGKSIISGCSYPILFQKIR